MMMKGVKMKLFKLISVLAALSFCLPLKIAHSKTVSSGSLNVLKNRTFSIQSTIARFTKYRQLKSIHVQERYSNEQRRARIRYELGGDGSGGDEFYWDSRTGASLSFNQEQLLCNDKELQDFHSDLFGLSSPQMIELMQLADSSAPGLGHLIGPAKLLFLVTGRASEMRAIFWPGGEEKSATVRNHQVMEFMLKLDNKFILSVFYEKQAFENVGRSIEELIPLQLVIKMPSIGQPVVIDFYKLEPPLNDGVDAGPMTSTQLDEFIFPLALNCMSLLAPQLTTVDLFGAYDFNSLRLSFRASSLWSPTNKQYEHFVAYDGMKQSMRINYRLSGGTEPSLIGLTDFRAGRTYSSLEGANECLVTKTTRATGLEAGGRPTLGALLVGTHHNLTYMGLARVRNFKAHVFEVYSDQLPRWFSQPQPVRFLSRGPTVERQFGVGLKADEKQQQEQQKYSVLIYMSADLTRPMQLEVYDLSLFKWLGSQRIIFTAQFDDFMYELNEAPNGDSRQDLFNLQDRCGLLGPNDGYAEVQLLLETESNEGANEVYWLKDYTRRNDALVTSLRDSLNLPSNLIYQLESKLIKSQANKKLKLSVAFRVAEHPRHFHTIHFLNNAELTTGGDVSEEVAVVEAQTPSECYLKLEQKPNGPFLLFYDNSSGRCYCKPIKDKKEETRGLNDTLDQVDSTHSGEVFMFEPSTDFASSLANSWLREGQFEQLEDRLLVLLAPSLRDPMRPLEVHGEVRARIRRAKLRGVNLMSRVAEAGQLARPRRQVAGVGLARTSAEVEDASGLATSLAACEAACLTSAKCQVWSFCLSRSRPQCLLSSAADIVIDDNNHDVNKLDPRLVLDVRCELHEKLHLDLFKLGWPSMRSFDADSFQAVGPVASAEHCARLCFLHNLKLIQQPQQQPQPPSSYLKTADFCRQFHYLQSPAKSERQRQVIASMMTTTTTGPKEGDSGGGKFCLFKWGPQVVEQPKERPISSSFETDTFDFKFELLYERLLGVGLIPSEQSDLEREAFHEVVMLGKKGAEIEHHRALLGERAASSDVNYQLQLEVSNLSDCAQHCFLQLTPLWPACRSFDVRKLGAVDGNGGHTAPATICTLNTNSRQTASDRLIRRESNDNDLWHYEARFETPIDGGRVTIDGQVEEGGLQMASLALVLVASLASALFLVALHSKRFLPKSEEEEHALTMGKLELLEQA